MPNISKIKLPNENTARALKDTTARAVFTPATSSASGTQGQVPAPTYAEVTAGKFLKADGTWDTPAGGTAPTGDDILLTGYTQGSDTTAVVATDKVNEAIAKHENKIALNQTNILYRIKTIKIGSDSTEYNPNTETGIATIPAYPTTLPASDVSAWAKAANKPTYTASEVGAIATTAKGANSGVAELDANGKVPSSQLPSYVDDVLEYSAKSSFPATGETGKIYVDTSTNLTYRWSGTAYVEISPSLALGTTSSTAYYGDKGKTAYDHATETKLGTKASGLYKVASTAQGHIASLTAVTKSDITGLGIPAQDTTYGVVSTSANGLAPKVTDTSKFLKGDGTWATPTNTWTAMVGATSSANGSVGYVNATPPKDGYNTKYLRADGSWQVPPNTTYSTATTSANGLMSATDKSKLDGIASGAQVNSITGVKGNSESTYRTGNVNLTAANIGAAPSSHTHNYAGSSSAGGAATSANKLNTNAGSTTQPVYFSNGVPVAITHPFFTIPINHNMVYRGQNLGATFTSAQHTALSSGNFTDLYLGDYWTKTVTIPAGTYTGGDGKAVTVPAQTNITLKAVIADFDTFYAGYASDYAGINTHHAAVIVTGFSNVVWNGTNSTAGGYVNSLINKWLVGSVLPQIETWFGSTKVLSHQKLLTNAITGDAASGCAWSSQKISLLSENQMYGSKIWGNSKAANGGYEPGEAFKRLNVFNHIDANLLFGNNNIWLRDIASAVGAAILRNSGFAYNYDASNTGIPPAALILLS